MADWGRLDIDANVIGYWGFDEANTGESVLDVASSPNNLSVTSPVSVQPGRVGNAMEFNGSSTFATPTVPTAVHRLTGDLTLLQWVRLDTYNLTGSFLRTVVACDEVGATNNENMLYGVFINSTGAVVYQHDQNSTTRVVVTTASGAVKQNRFQSVCVVRSDAGGGTQNIAIYVDNVLQTIATVTVGGTPSTLPIPAPTGGSLSVLKYGKSKISDSGWWDGLIDECSIHNTVRAHQPYLRAAFFRVAFADATTRISVFDKLQSVSSVDMQRGLRWWAYVRDQSVYVVQENPVGVFRPEVLLTTTPGLLPGGTALPSLVYDAATDTLLVVFVNSGRVYKITALADDAPVTQNMPYTSDAPTVVKAQDQDDYCRFGAGASAAGTESIENDLVMTASFALKSFINDSANLGSGASATDTEEFQNPTTSPDSPAYSAFFFENPSFGVAITAASGDYGYFVYEVSGGAQLLLGSASLSNNNTLWHFPITSRIKGRAFVGVPKTRFGAPSGKHTNVIVDMMGDYVLESPGNGNFYGQGDYSDMAKIGAGGAPQQDTNWYEIVKTDQFTLKVPNSDYCEFAAGASAAGSIGDVQFVGVTKSAQVASESV